MKSGSWASYQSALPHEARSCGDRDDEPTRLEKRMDLTKDSKSGTERALVAVGTYKTAIIIATDGPWMAGEIAGIPSDSADDVLGDWFFHGKPAGLYLWEGSGEWKCDDTPEYPGEPYIDWSGTVSHVSPAQVPDLLAMRPPEEADDPRTPEDKRTDAETSAEREFRESQEF